MKIFLSSTVYDLHDIRALTVDRLEKRGHEVLHHERPTFPARHGLHSHDQCILAIDDCDLVLCVVDRRYGSPYSGTSFKAQFPDQTFDVRAGKNSVQVTVPASQLSITWCELIRAYSKGRSVITFARSRTLDEKLTRRANQDFEKFKPAYADRNEVFDLLDWVTKRPLDNWIVPFTSVLDYERKLDGYISELEKPVVRPSGTPPAVITPNPVTIVVEGQSDYEIVSSILNRLALPLRFDVLRMGGRYAILQNLSSIRKAFDKSSAIVVLVDADTTDQQAIENMREQFEMTWRGTPGAWMHLAIAEPEIEAWLLAAIEPNAFESGKPRFKAGDDTRKQFRPWTPDNNKKWLALFEKKFDSAVDASSSLYEFVGLLQRIAEEVKSEVGK